MAATGRMREAWKLARRDGATVVRRAREDGLTSDIVDAWVGVHNDFQDDGTYDRNVDLFLGRGKKV